MEQCNRHSEMCNQSMSMKNISIEEAFSTKKNCLFVQFSVFLKTVIEILLTVFSKLGNGIRIFLTSIINVDKQSNRPSKR
jgi:hypothetical protein